MWCPRAQFSFVFSVSVSIFSFNLWLVLATLSNKYNVSLMIHVPDDDLDHFDFRANPLLNENFIFSIIEKMGQYNQYISPISPWQKMDPS